jgi:O-antigen ligase
MIWLLLGIWIGGFFCTFKTLFTFNERTGVWGEVWKYIIVKHPIIGVGLGQFKIVFPKIEQSINSPYLEPNNKLFTSIKWTFAHNEYIQFWAEMGAIGLLIGLGYLVTILWKGRKLINQNQRIMFAGILAMLLTSITWFNFHLTGAVLFIIYLAMYEKEVGI